MNGAPPAESYYGRPILKAPVWKPEIAWYFFAGGISGACDTLALVARFAGEDDVARHANRTSAAFVAVCPPLLIKDLGRPKRFLNMLRVFKPSSPMSVGSWILSVSGGAASTATVLDATGLLPRVRAAAELVAGLSGPLLSTYTAVLVADTAVPVWHEARRELPFVFAGGSLASAGAALMLVTGGGESVARRLTLIGSALELAATQVMEKRLGWLGEPYHTGEAGRYARAAKLLTGGGAALALVGRGRPLRVAGAALVLAGTICERFAVYKAGGQSAADPRYTVEAQRQRLERQGGRPSRAGSLLGHA